MKLSAGVTTGLLGLLLLCPPARGQAEVQSASTLGRGHLWLKHGQVDLDEQTKDAWGIDRQGFWALEGYGGQAMDFYLGGEVGHTGGHSAVTRDGEVLEDIDLWWAELNEKKALNLGRGWSFDFGLGASFFYVEGREITIQDGVAFRDPLADIGFGTQVFIDFSWQARRLLIGLDAKYQWAFDVIAIDYSNLRLGGHVGLAF